MFGWRLPSPAWKTLPTLSPWAATISLTRRSTYGSFVRGITPSITMYAGDTRPYAPNADLRPFHSSARSASSLAVRHHDLEPEHVIGRDAVLQRVRAARVVGDVSADRTRLLARGIGRVVVALRPDLPGEVEVHEARLDDRELVVVVHLEDAVHPHEGDHDAALRGEAPAREPRAGAARHEGHPLAVCEPDDRRHVRRGRREHDEVRQRPEQREAVGLVHEQLVGVGEHRSRAEDRLKFSAELDLTVGRQRRHSA